MAVGRGESRRRQPETRQHGKNVGDVPDSFQVGLRKQEGMVGTMGVKKDVKTTVKTGRDVAQQFANNQIIKRRKAGSICTSEGTEARAMFQGAGKFRTRCPPWQPG